MYGGASVIKSRLLPWLGQGIFTAGALTSDTSMGILAEVSRNFIHKTQCIVQIEKYFQ